MDPFTGLVVYGMRLAWSSPEHPVDWWKWVVGMDLGFMVMFTLIWMGSKWSR
jgi:hypothetical protein